MFVWKLNYIEQGDKPYLSMQNILQIHKSEWMKSLKLLSMNGFNSYSPLIIVNLLLILTNPDICSSAPISGNLRKPHWVFAKHLYPVFILSGGVLLLFLIFNHINVWINQFLTQCEFSIKWSENMHHNYNETVFPPYNTCTFQYIHWNLI